MIPIVLSWHSSIFSRGESKVFSLSLLFDYMALLLLPISTIDSIAPGRHEEA